MTDHISEAVSWCLAAALLVVLVLLIRQRQITAGVRRRNATLEDSLRTRDEEVRHLVDVRLPSIADALSQPGPLPGLRDEKLAGTAFAQSLHSVMEQFTRAVDKAQSRADASAKAALKASMRAVQGLANEQQVSISEMQERHDNPDVLRDLLEIDHANAQFGRRAQAIAVLCGSWPGRQRLASSLTDVVRGAKSRIRDYQRVQVHALIDVAVVSRAVEPAVLAVAELLDNAARHSQPNTSVEVSLQPVHNGACIVIDDAGVGMDGLEVQRAANLLSGQRAVDVSRLGDPPQFGFAVVGLLAARYGFSVSVDTRSPYGGVRAVLFLPTELLTHIDPDGRPGTAGQDPEGAEPLHTLPSRRTRPPRRAPQAPTVPAQAQEPSPIPHQAPAPIPHQAQPPAPAPAPAASAPEPAPAPAPQPSPDSEGTRVYGTTAGGLPKRRRREAAATPPPGDWTTGAGQTGAADPDTGAFRVRSAKETASRMGAFARGTRSGRSATQDSAPHHDEGNRQA
ncbi:ATP-binding protein [Streptomyces rapamycinicus]|uniref:histidine kinase n=2 Tax=Streptomyces rapamycinicus TaxID=1226757 RepID=A0A0A0NC22_STRRN|nr:ATP-binding protein [Streptomyces rapamycinicus]AGP54519.1 ATP-binding protein [Streptomyces rapamycinicus NRRL 5491]MBB4782025.1 outer membrane biosynthesis protein TonB [Streptomyces rapamycinicus]RLV73332.1 ATP-binding protein [Streptomyces rapamycinicus NRRL 5491]UTO62573.1 ATP-binding protein [Streptomyces rapamycinicus]UTP30528.1 ATP-binding protein [Streptomyces rapamycinicus NRRL 5491]